MINFQKLTKEEFDKLNNKMTEKEFEEYLYKCDGKCDRCMGAIYENDTVVGCCM